MRVACGESLALSKRGRRARAVATRNRAAATRRLRVGCRFAGSIAASGSAANCERDNGRRRTDAFASSATLVVTSRSAERRSAGEGSTDGVSCNRRRSVARGERTAARVRSSSDRAVAASSRSTLREIGSGCRAVARGECAARSRRLVDRLAGSSTTRNRAADCELDDCGRRPGALSSTATLADTCRSAERVACRNRAARSRRLEGRSERWRSTSDRAANREVDASSYLIADKFLKKKRPAAFLEREATGSVLLEDEVASGCCRSTARANRSRRRRPSTTGDSATGGWSLLNRRLFGRSVTTCDRTPDCERDRGRRRAGSLPGSSTLPDRGASALSLPACGSSAERVRGDCGVLRDALSDCTALSDCGRSCLRVATGESSTDSNRNSSNKSDATGNGTARSGRLEDRPRNARNPRLPCDTVRRSSIDRVHALPRVLPNRAPQKR